MKSILLVAIIAVSAGAGSVLQPSHLATLFSEVYPLDAAKRQALDLCMLRDPNFNRLSLAAREACFAHELDGPKLSTARATVAVPPNGVALHQAVAWEGAPSNDVRVMEASQGFSASLADRPLH